MPMWEGEEEPPHGEKGLTPKQRYVLPNCLKIEPHHSKVTESKEPLLNKLFYE